MRNDFLFFYLPARLEECILFPYRLCSVPSHGNFSVSYKCYWLGISMYLFSSLRLNFVEGLGIRSFDRHWASKCIRLAKCIRELHLMRLIISYNAFLFHKDETWAEDMGRTPKNCRFVRIFSRLYDSRSNFLKRSAPKREGQLFSYSKKGKGWEFLFTTPVLLYLFSFHLFRCPALPLLPSPWGSHLLRGWRGGKFFKFWEITHWVPSSLYKLNGKIVDTVDIYNNFSHWRIPHISNTQIFC